MDKKIQQSSTKNKDTLSLRGPEGRELLEAFVGFDVRLLRTIVALVLHPVRVARAALQGQKGAYIGQVRLFVFLFSLTTLFMVATKFNKVITVEASFKNHPDWLKGYMSLIAEHGASLADVNAATMTWVNWLNMPVNLIFLVSMALLFKAFAPKITFFGHMLLYITANNTGSIIGMPMSIALVWLGMPVLVSSVLPAAITLFYLGIFVWVFMRRSLVGGIGKLVLLVGGYGLSILLTALVIQVSLHQLAKAKFGQSPTGYMIEQAISKAKSRR